MKKIFYLYSKSLLSKLALVAILIVGGGNSAWGDDLVVTINENASNTNSSVPIPGSYVDNEVKGHAQFIIPSSDLTSLNGYEIKKLTFFTSGSSYATGSWGNATFSVYIKEVAKTTFDSAEYDDWDQMTLFYTGSLSVSDNKMDISSNQNIYEYGGGNLLIGIKQTASGTSKYLSWIGANQSSSSKTAVYMGYNHVIGQYNFIPKVALTASEVTGLKKPRNLSVSNVGINSAQLNWIEGGSAVKWQIKYSTVASFNPDSEGTSVDVTTNPYILEGLTPETIYYAYVRATNGADEYSAWSSNMVSFKPTEGIDVIVNEKTTTNSNVPIYGNQVASLVMSQMIILKSNLSSMQNRQITELTFYGDASCAWGDATFEVYLKETSNTIYSSSVMDSWGTLVLNKTKLSTDANGEMHIELDTPFNYGDNNLMVGFKQIDAGSNKSINWHVASATYGTVIYTYGSTTYKASISPKIKFTSIPVRTAPVQMGLNGYTTFASPYPLDLTAANLPSGLKAYKAAVDAENSRVNFTEINQTVPANTGMLLEGAAGTTYAIPVAASGTTPDGNAFFVNSTGGTFTAESGYTYYGMKKATSAEDPIVFATFAPATVAIPTNKAYLKVENAPSGASRQLVCVFSDNTTTAIDEIANRQNGQNSYFNLAGQRVDGSRFAVNGSGLKPGLYIINGKKVVIK